MRAEKQRRKARATGTPEKVRPVDRVSLLQRLKRARARREEQPHRSFRLTRKRDIPRSAQLPGLLSFTLSTGKQIWRYRTTFSWLLIFYVVIALLLIGFSQQDQYRSLTGALSDVSKEAGENGLDTVTQIGGLFGATLVGSLNSDLSELQQFYLVGLYILMVLVVVWLLRQLVAGNPVKVRDGIYNAGAPLISSACIIALMLLQALPGSLGILLFSIATRADGVFGSGVVAMCFGVLALLLVVLSLYWLSSSFFALIIVTLPGTYPMQAIRGAREIALGKRTQLLIRLVWLLIVLFVLWIVILVPAILLDYWVQVSWLPIVTLAVQIATAVSFIYGVSYVFLLYRKMITKEEQ